MKKIKHFGTVFTVSALVLAAAASSAAAAAAGGFTDVAKNAWYAEAVRYCSENGLMSGTSDTEFSPNKTMTRAMLATALYRKSGSPAVSGNDTFPDTKDGEWYSDAILWASQQEIMTGYKNGKFGVTDAVTREQIVTILWRMAGSPASGVQLHSFADRSDISDYAAAAVLWADSNGIVSGKAGNKFDPKGNATRAEVASILANNAKRSDEDEFSNDENSKENADEEIANAASEASNAASENEAANISEYSNEVALMVNDWRIQQGIAPLTLDSELCKLAQLKAEDMRDNNYFNHNSPTYGNSNTMIKNFGINALTTGENIAMGQKTPQQVMQEWMNSQGHRENILNSNFKKIGVGYCTGGSGKVYWVQMFVK